jgi:4-amino-4-deoxy-L-arabinose transferase-like glycosyltransferase
MRFGSPLKIFLSLLAIGIYLSCCLTHLELPGLYYDEVLFANAAMGNIDGSFIAWQIQVGSAKLPVMLMPYIGALKAYFYAPIFATFKPSVMTVRLPTVLVGLVTLALTYAVVKHWLGEKVALIALLLLASDPTFIFVNKLDWSPATLMMVIRMASLFLLQRWLAAGKLHLLALAGFLLGLGIYDKFIFIWFVAALVIAFPLCFREKLRSRMSLGALCVFLGCFVLGCWPVIAYNWRFHGMTFNNPNKLNLSLAGETLLRSITLMKTLNGTATNEFTSNGDFQRLPLLLQREGGAALRRLINPSGQSLGTLTVPALVIAVALILVLWKRGRMQLGASAQFFFLLCAFITVLIYLTPGSAGLQHFVMLYPFSTILIAFAAGTLGTNGEISDRPWRAVARNYAGPACVVVLVLVQLFVDVETLKSFATKGGVGTWSDAIYKLADYASAHTESSFTLMDWGFNNQLLVLTQGRIQKQEAFAAVRAARGDEEQIRVMHAYLTRPKSIFVFHAPAYEIVPMLELFERTLERYKLIARKVATFYQRDGQPVYLLYEVSPFRPETP